MSSAPSSLATNPVNLGKLAKFVLAPIIHLNRKYGLKYRIDYIRNYVKEFGPVAGLNLYRRLNRTSAANTHFEVSVKTMSFPVAVRPGTADSSTFDSVFIWKQYDLPLPAGTKIIFDCGANIGLASAWFANVCPGARIVALEPQLDNYELLKSNCRYYANITTHQAALWNRVGELSLCDSTVRVDSYQYTDGEGDSSERVAAYDVSTLMALHNVSTIDVLKIDIEGAETVVFDEPCQAWLDKVRMLIIEIHGDEARTAFEAVISQSNFQWTHTTHGENDVLLRGPSRKSS
jgi:FkbM family methyltransferase